MKVNNVCMICALMTISTMVYAQRKDRDYYATQKSMIDLYAIPKSTDAKKDSSHNVIKSYSLGNDVVKIFCDEADRMPKDTVCGQRRLLSIYYENKTAFLIQVTWECERENANSGKEPKEFYGIDNSPTLDALRKAEFKKYFMKAAELIKSHN